MDELVLRRRGQEVRRHRLGPEAVEVGAAADCDLVVDEPGVPERALLVQAARGSVWIYGLGERFDGNLKRVHLRESTPYNTYVIRGLPPTPIALPGGKSIDAALHPGPGDYLYFVSRGDGTSQFSRSHAEHLAAVRKYQLQ